MKCRACMHGFPRIGHCLQLHSLVARFTGYLHSLFLLPVYVTSASYVDGRMHFILSPLALACNALIRDGSIRWPTYCVSAILLRRAISTMIICLILSNACHNKSPFTDLNFALKHSARLLVT